MSTWEAIKAFFLALPGIVRIAEWWHNRYARKVDDSEAAAKEEDRQNDAISMDPDRVGPALRRRLRGKNG